MLISKCLSWDLGVGIWGEFGIYVVQEGKDCVVEFELRMDHTEIKLTKCPLTFLILSKGC